MTLQAYQLSFAYGATPVLKDVNFKLSPGVTALIGPNAAGKSTLLKCLAGILKPGGRVRINERDVGGLNAGEAASLIGYLPQAFSPRAVLTVFETVLLGRQHQLGWRITPEDTRRVEQLLDEMGISSLAGRYINELSGGQAQMVAIAQALVREPSFLLLDEPTSNLDLRRQFEVCALIRELTAARGISTAIALHDLNMAAKYADEVFVLENGSIRCSGSPAAVLTREMLAAVYRVDAGLDYDLDGRPVITIMGPTADCC